MWLGYACSLLFVISYHWHPPLHIHIYTCQIWHLYPQGGDQVLSHLLASLTVPPSLFASHTWLSIPFNVNDVCFGPSPQVFCLVLCIAPSALQSEKESKPWTTSMICGSPCCFNGCQAGSLFPPSLPSLWSVWLHNHGSPSDVVPPSDYQLSSPGPDGWRDREDERGRRLL